VGGISELLEAARRASARTVNAFMTATYWEIGRRIVEFEQRGEKTGGIWKALLERLSKDLTLRYGAALRVPTLSVSASFTWPSPPPQFARHCRTKHPPH